MHSFICSASGVQNPPAQQLPTSVASQDKVQRWLFCTKDWGPIQPIGHSAPTPRNKEWTSFSFRDWFFRFADMETCGRFGQRYGEGECRVGYCGWVPHCLHGGPYSAFFDFCVLGVDSCSARCYACLHFFATRDANHCHVSGLCPSKSSTLRVQLLSSTDSWLFNCFLFVDYVHLDCQKRSDWSHILPLPEHARRRQKRDAASNDVSLGFSMLNTPAIPDKITIHWHFVLMCENRRGTNCCNEIHPTTNCWDYNFKFFFASFIRSSKLYLPQYLVLFPFYKVRPS